MGFFSVPTDRPTDWSLSTLEQSVKVFPGVWTRLFFLSNGKREKKKSLQSHTKKKKAHRPKKRFVWPASNNKIALQIFENTKIDLRKEDVLAEKENRIKYFIICPCMPKPEIIYEMLPLPLLIFVVATHRQMTSWERTPWSPVPQPKSAHIFFLWTRFTRSPVTLSPRRSSQNSTKTTYKSPQIKSLFHSNIWQ